MATDTEALDIIESKIRELELKVYGEKPEPTENFNPVIDSLLQANTLMVATLSGREKFTSIFKRLHELNEYLELNPLNDDPRGLVTKLNIILSLEKEYKDSVQLMEKVNELKPVLDDDKIKNTQLLKNDLNDLIAKHLSKKERLEEINNEVGEVLSKFNEVCLEISKSFFLLNEAISKLENENLPKSKHDA